MNSFIKNGFVFFVLFFSVNFSDAGEFTHPYLVYYGGGDHFKGEDYSQLAKYELLILDRFRYKKKPRTWDRIKAHNPSVKIFLYQLGPEVSSVNDHYQDFYLNNIGRFNKSRGHPMGDLNNDNPDLFLKDGSGKRIPIQYYENNYLLDFSSKKFTDYWLKATMDDVVGRPWAADGIMVDNGLTYYVRPIKKILFPQPAKFEKKGSWDSAMNDFLSAITGYLQSKNQMVMVNRGNSRYEEPFMAWLDLDKVATPPDIVLEEGAFAGSWGLGSVQFWSVSQWERQVSLPSRIENSNVALLSHTDIGPGETGYDSSANAVSFKQIFLFAFGSYHLSKRMDDKKTYFSFDYSRNDGPFKRISWFDIYQNLDFGKPLGTFKKIDDNASKIYFREFEKGFIYVNPDSKNYMNLTIPKDCSLVNISLSGELTILPSNKFSIDSHSSVFMIKSKFLNE